MNRERKQNCCFVPCADAVWRCNERARNFEAAECGKDESAVKGGWVFPQHVQEIGIGRPTGTGGAAQREDVEWWTPCSQTAAPGGSVTGFFDLHMFEWSVMKKRSIPLPPCPPKGMKISHMCAHMHTYLNTQMYTCAHAHTHTHTSQHTQWHI